MLARLAHNQLEEKCDWTLSPELRCVDYASRHLDEPGAREAAIGILDALRRPDLSNPAGPDGA